MNSFNTEENELDKKKLEIMKLRIIRAEKENVKTREKSKEGMVEEIRKIIIEEANKSY